MAQNINAFLLVIAGVPFFIFNETISSFYRAGGDYVRFVLPTVNPVMVILVNSFYISLHQMG